MSEDIAVPMLPEILASLGNEEPDAPSFNLPGRPDTLYRAVGLRRAEGPTEVDVLFEPVYAGDPLDRLEIADVEDRDDGVIQMKARLQSDPDALVAVRMDFLSGRAVVVDADAFFPHWTHHKGMRWTVAHRSQQYFDRLEIVSAMLAQEPQVVRLHDKTAINAEELFAPPDSPELMQVSLESVRFSVQPSMDTMQAGVFGQAVVGEEQGPVVLHWDTHHQPRIHVVSIIPDAKPVAA